MIVGTVDKFARLAYEDEAATMFGNVEWYDARAGITGPGRHRETGVGEVTVALQRPSVQVTRLIGLS